MSISTDLIYARPEVTTGPCGFPCWCTQTRYIRLCASVRISHAQELNKPLSVYYLKCIQLYPHITICLHDLNDHNKHSCICIRCAIFRNATHEFCVFHIVHWGKIIFLENPTIAHSWRSAIQFYSFHRHISVTLVSIFMVAYSKNISNRLVII
jgi:hypothetical protein